VPTDFNSTDDDGDTTNGDQHYKSVLHVWQSCSVTHTTRVTPAMVRRTGLKR